MVCAVAAAVAYGGATAVQHNAAHNAAPNAAPNAASNTAPNTAPDQISERADARRLLALLVDPRWLLSIGGDALGLVLQVVALATGPVVVVQPLLVLAVAVALPVGWALGGPRPGRRDVLAGLAVIGALAAFFVLVGDPGSGGPLGADVAAVTAVATLLVGGALCAGVRGRSTRVRAVVFGAVAGAGFGVVGVLLNATAEVFDANGFSGLLTEAGWVPLVALVILGAASMILTQVSFQIGELGASFPANQAAAPVIAVILGATLLHEHVPLSPGQGVLYAACLAVVVLGTVRLAGTDRHRSARGQ